MCENKKAVIKIKINEGGKMPTKAHPTDAGWDLYSADNMKPVVLQPHAVVSIPTHVHVSIPPGYFIKFAERSGVSINTPLKLKAGTIDSGYIGELKMVFENDSHNPIIVEPNTKLVQMIIHEVPESEFVQVDSLEETDRGVNGFGSSGY